jgi:hypothetical protein
MTKLQYDVIIDTSRVNNELEKLTNKFEMVYSKISSQSLKLAKQLSNKISKIEIQSSEKSINTRLALEKTFWENKLLLTKSYSARINNVINNYNRKIKATGSTISSGIIGGNQEYKQTGGVGVGGVMAAEIIGGSILRKNIRTDINKNTGKNIGKNKRATYKIKNGILTLQQNVNQESNQKNVKQESNQKIVKQEKEALIENAKKANINLQNAKNELKEANKESLEFLKKHTNKEKLKGKDLEIFNKEKNNINDRLRIGNLNKKIAQDDYNDLKGNLKKQPQSKKGGGFADFSSNLLKTFGYGAAIAGIYKVGSSIIESVSGELKNSISDMQIANKTFQTLPSNERGITVEQQRTQIRSIKGQAKKTRQAVVTETGLTNDQVSGLLQGYQESGGKLLPIEQAIRLGSATQAFGLDPTIVGSTAGLISLALRDQGKVTGNKRSEENIAKQAEEIFLKLSKSGNLGTIDISHLGRSDWGQLLSVVQRVSPAEDPLQQLAPIFEAMQSSKLSASEAVTGVENFYNDLLTPGNQKDLKKFGINPFTKKGDYKGANEIFTEIMTKAGTDPRVLSKFQGIRGQRLLSGQTQIWRQIKNEEQNKIENSGKKVNNKELTEKTAERFKKYLEENRITLDTKEIESILAETMQDPAIKLAKAQEQLSQNIANLAMKVIPTLTNAVQFLADVFLHNNSRQKYAKEERENKENLGNLNNIIKQNNLNKDISSERQTQNQRRIDLLKSLYEESGVDINPLTGEMTENETGKEIKKKIKKTEQEKQFWKNYDEESPERAIEFASTIKDNPELKTLSDNVFNSKSSEIYKIFKISDKIGKNGSKLSEKYVKYNLEKLSKEKEKLEKEKEKLEKKVEYTEYTEYTEYANGEKNEEKTLIDKRRIIGLRNRINRINKTSENLKNNQLDDTIENNKEDILLTPRTKEESKKIENTKKILEEEISSLEDQKEEEINNGNIEKSKLIEIKIKEKEIEWSNNQQKLNTTYESSENYSNQDSGKVGYQSTIIPHKTKKQVEKEQKEQIKKDEEILFLTKRNKELENSIENIPIEDSQEIMDEFNSNIKRIEELKRPLPIIPKTEEESLDYFGTQIPEILSAVIKEVKIDEVKADNIIIPESGWSALISGLVEALKLVSAKAKNNSDIPVPVSFGE